MAARVMELSVLDATDRAAVRALAASAESADGVGALSDDGFRALEANAGEGVVHLLATERAVPVGYAVVFGRGDGRAAEVVVDPSARRRGVGAALVTGLLRAEGDGLRVWAHGDLAGARALAASVGARPRRVLLKMRADLTPGDERLRVDVPVGLRLTTLAEESAARGGDVVDAELLAVNNAAFSWHPEQGGWDVSDLAVRRREGWYDPAGVFLVLDEAGGLLGFHWTKEHTDAGEVYVVASSPRARGRGIGDLVTRAGLAHLVGRGHRVVVLYVEGDNEPALVTYRRLGFVEEERHVVYSRGATGLTDPAAGDGPEPGEM